MRMRLIKPTLGQTNKILCCSGPTDPKTMKVDSKIKFQIKHTKIEDIKSSKVYTCGSFLFPPDSDYIVIRQALT